MRVLQVYRTYFPDPPGGIQETMRQIALATKPHDVQTRLLTLSPQPVPRTLERPEGLVIREKSWGAPASCDIGGLAALRAFWELARWAEVIHLHFPWPFGDVLNLLRPCGKPLVLTYHSDIVRQKALGKLYAPLMAVTLRSATAVVATSPAYVKTSPVLQRYVAPEKLSVIPIGIEDLAGQPVSAAPLETYGLKPQGYFLALGVLRYYKGLHHLVAAAAKLDAPVVIAGSGPENERLRAQAAELGASNVRFTGRVSEEEKAALLQGCRALVLSSHLRSEAFGVALLDAAMRARPMICCEIGTGTSYVNQDGLTGFVVPAGDPDALSQAMAKLWRDPALAQTMGQAARQRYLDLFSAEKMGKAYADLYNRRSL